MLINRDYKTTIFAGIIIGIFTALTTKSPGGQLPVSYTHLDVYKRQNIP